MDGWVFGCVNGGYVCTKVYYAQRSGVTTRKAFQLRLSKLINTVSAAASSLEVGDHAH